MACIAESAVSRTEPDWVGTGKKANTSPNVRITSPNVRIYDADLLSNRVSGASQLVDFGVRFFAQTIQ